MPLIIKRPRREILLYHSGVTRTARSLAETVDQLQGQLRAARQHEAQLKFENTVLATELAEVRLELARRSARDAFAAVPSSLRH